MSVDPAWLLGLGLRALAVVQLVAFASLYRDVLPLAGSRGVHPVADVLAASRRDFGARRFLYFPSLLHLASSDRALRVWILLGAAASCAALVGGPLTPHAFTFAWLVYLSFDVAIDLLYPWDAMLLEASLLAVLAPPLLFLPSSVALEAAAHPLLVWAFRFLAFRVVFGFGKYKFFGPGALHTDYLKSFLVTQPMPRPLGMRAQRLPRWMHQVALLGLFVVEVLSPWLWLGGPSLRWIPSVLVSLLMVGIQLTGNFGFFNLATIALALLAATPTPSSFDVALGGPALALDGPHLAALALLGLGLCHLPFHSWIARSWMYWPDLARVGRGALAPLQAIVRALAPFRLAHAYGVFSPESGPRGAWVPRFEATLDGARWAPYRYRHYPTDAGFRGTSVSPMFPRFDHALVYEAMGLGLGNLMGSVVGGGNPYRASRALFLERVQRRLLEGEAPVRSLFAEVPFDGARPLAVRVSFQFLAYREGDVARYEEIPLGLHLPARTLEESEPLGLPSPAAFLPDERVYTARALGLGDPVRDLDGLAEALAPLVSRGPRDLQHMFTCDAASPAHLRALEEPLFRAAWLLRARAAPAAGEGELELWLRTLAVAARGPDAVRDALACGVDRALQEVSLEDGLAVLTRVRPTWVRFHAAKARLREATMRGAARRPPSFAPGVLRLLPRLAALAPEQAGEAAVRAHARDPRALAGGTAPRRPSLVRVGAPVASQ